MDCLKNLMKELKLVAGGNMSNKLRVEKILRHLEYSEEKISEILSKFPTKKSKESQENDEETDLEDMCDEQRGEAETLNHLINKMNEKEPEKRPKTESLKEKVPGPAWEPHGPKPEKEEIPIPPGCTLNVRMPVNASPNVQGTLPPGETWKKFKSHTRSFCVDAGSQSSFGSKPRASLSQEMATAQVVAWLWEWFESNPERAGKRHKGSGM